MGKGERRRDKKSVRRTERRSKTKQGNSRERGKWREREKARREAGEGTGR